MPLILSLVIFALFISKLVTAEHLTDLAKTLCQASPGVHIDAAQAVACYNKGALLNDECVFAKVMTSLTTVRGGADRSYPLEAVFTAPKNQLMIQIHLSLMYHKALLDFLQDTNASEGRLNEVASIVEELNGALSQCQNLPADAALPVVDPGKLNPEVVNELKIGVFSRGNLADSAGNDFARLALLKGYQKFSLKVLTIWEISAQDTLKTELTKAKEYYENVIMAQRVTPLMMALAPERFPSFAVNCNWPLGVFLSLLNGYPKCTWNAAEPAGSNEEPLTEFEMEALRALQKHTEELMDRTSKRFQVFAWTPASLSNLKTLTYCYYGSVEPYFAEQLALRDSRLTASHLSRLVKRDSESKTKVGIHGGDFTIDYIESPQQMIVAEVAFNPPKGKPLTFTRSRIQVARLTIDSLLELDLHPEAIIYLQLLQQILLKASFYPAGNVKIKVTGTVIAFMASTIMTACAIAGILSFQRKRSSTRTSA